VFVFLREKYLSTAEDGAYYYLLFFIKALRDNPTSMARKTKQPIAVRIPCIKRRPSMWARATSKHPMQNIFQPKSRKTIARLA
jgi:hypothetical protein